MIKDNLKHRIEKLSEDERRLLAFKIDEAINSNTITPNSNNTQKRIVAYIKSDNYLDKNNIKSYLKNKLPDYMIPSSIKIVKEIPLLPNGKVNKKELIRTKEDTPIFEVSQSSIITPKNELETKLLEIWEDVLSFSPISTNDNFFEIGGDSILSIQVINKARNNGTMLSPNLLFEHQTISELSKVLLEVENKKLEWDFVAKIRSGGSKKPLFCIHSGGGHVFFYGLLKKYLHEDRPIYAIQPAGLYGSGEMHTTVEEMTTEYLKVIRKIQPNGPYNILVYCFSTSIGNEMATQLDKIGEEINIIVADTMASPWSINDGDTLKSRIMSFLKRFLRNPLKSIRIFLEDRTHIIQTIKHKYFGNIKEKQIEILKANLRKISLDYTWKENNGKVSLLLTKRTDENYKFVIKSWKKYAKGGVKIYHTKGNHTTLFEEPDIEYVAEQIDKCILD